MSGVLTQGGIWTEKSLIGKDIEEDSHLQAKERNLEQTSPSEPSRNTPLHFLLLDFLPPTSVSVAISVDQATQRVVLWTAQGRC